MDESWFDKLLNWHVAAWAAFWLNAVALLRIRNERLRDRNTEKAGDWERLRAERDRLQQRVLELEHRNAVLLEQNFELLGRAVIAEGELVARDKAGKRPTFLGGAEGVADAQNRRDGNGGGK